MTFNYKQLAEQAEIEIGKLPNRLWNSSSVKEILRRYPRDSIRKIMVDHLKFGQMFGAGKQLAKWCGEVLDGD